MLGRIRPARGGFPLQETSVSAIHCSALLMPLSQRISFWPEDVTLITAGRIFQSASPLHILPAHTHLRRALLAHKYLSRMSMYLRVKRQKQTIFVHCDPSDTILAIKQKIQAINKVETGDQRLNKVENKKDKDGKEINPPVPEPTEIVFDENKTVKECKLEDGAIVCLAYKKSQDPPEWEDMAIHAPEALCEEQASRESM